MLRWPVGRIPRRPRLGVNLSTVAYNVLVFCKLTHKHRILPFKLIWIVVNLLHLVHLLERVTEAREERSQPSIKAREARRGPCAKARVARKEFGVKAPLKDTSMPNDHFFSKVVRAQEICTSLNKFYVESGMAIFWHVSTPLHVICDMLIRHKSRCKFSASENGWQFIRD